MQSHIFLTNSAGKGHKDTLVFTNMNQAAVHILEIMMSWTTPLNKNTWSITVRFLLIFF